MGRKPIGDSPMTPAQRKARSRAMQQERVEVELRAAMKLASEWCQCMDAGRPGATDADIRGGFAEIQSRLIAAEAALLRF